MKCSLLVEEPIKLPNSSYTVFVYILGSFSKHDGNLNGDVLRNKRIVHTKQRERIISSLNGLINNVLVL